MKTSLHNIPLITGIRADLTSKDMLHRSMLMGKGFNRVLDAILSTGLVGDSLIAPATNSDALVP